MLKNRIRKNYRHLRKWAKRIQTDAFRIYDRDIKEYPLAIDFYAQRFCVHFFTFDRDKEEPDSALRAEVEGALYSLFGPVPIYWRTRMKRDKLEQYEKQSSAGDFFIVHEYGTPFWVNLSDYLDTGLFLDHRETRRFVSQQVKGKTLLNLFAYTCAFSVQALVGGATKVWSVDLSNTYTEWGKRNFALNGFRDTEHPIIREDCLRFLDQREWIQPFDWIILDPPTLSRSKKMDAFFDIQRDYSELIHQAWRWLAPGGSLLFSTNCRSFRLDPTTLPPCDIQDITERTHAMDFRSHKIRQGWLLHRA